MFQNFVLLFFVTANLCFVNARKLKTEVSTATVNSMTADPLTTKTAPAFTTSGVFANQSINDNWKKLLDKNVTYRFAKYFPRSGDNATEEKVELNETDVDKATSGGYKSKMGYFPSEVDVKDALSSKHKCSGTLVEDKHVLSTAHCVFKSVVAELAVMAGDTNLLPNQLSSRESRRVQLIAKHPDYLDDANTSLEFNIAVLRLDMPFTRSNYLHPAVIPTTRIGKNSQCFFAGWELGNEGSIEGSTSYDLYFLEVQTMDMEYCFKCVGNAICAGSNETKACINDDGGPLMCNGVLHGIYVGSANNCQSLTGIYTDVVFYKQWIDRIIDWGGEDPMPLPLPYARRRMYRIDKADTRTASEAAKYSTVMQIIILLTMIGFTTVYYL